MNNKILIVEDESSIRTFVKINMEANKFQVTEAESGESALEKIHVDCPDIVILDLMLPGIDGLKVCEIIRREHKEVGIIMLTAKSQDMDKIIALEFGADDYMTKPFNPLELVARTKSLLRRLKIDKDDGFLYYPPFKLDISAQRMFKDDKELELTPTEFLLMKYFMKCPGKALSRDELLNVIWGKNYIGDPKIVDVNIRRLRYKIEAIPSKPVFIETVWGFGYRWREE
jgi:two-component system, OmpR family, alkaline phosphatase synthesis response regulator PhoP